MKPSVSALLRSTARSLLALGFGAPGFAGDATAPSYLTPMDNPVRLEKIEVSARADKPYTVPRIVTATKTETALIDIPQSLTVVTRELIDDQAMRSIGDLTRYVPGVGIAQGEGNRDTPVFRGNASTADFFVDGVRDDVQYFRDFYNVDRVEVLKGPNAMIFGRGGSGGLINRVTKQARGQRLYELGLHAGPSRQARATLDAGDRLSPALAYRIAALYENGGSFRDGVTLRRHGVNPTFAYSPAPATTLRFGYEFFHDARVADRGVPSFRNRPVATAASTFFGDPTRSPSRATVHGAFAILEHRFNPGLELRQHTRFNAYEKFYQNIYPDTVDATGANVAILAYNNATDRVNFTHQTDLTFDADTGPLRHRLLAGLEVARQETDNLRLTGYFTDLGANTTSASVPLAAPRYTGPVGFRPGATDADNQGVARTVALYAQDQVTLLPKLQAVAGVRLEKFSIAFRNRRTASSSDRADRLVSPRFGLVGKLSPVLSLYGAYSTAFLPRAGEQLASLTPANRAFDPEAFANREVGLKWDLRPDLAFTAATYRLDRRNVVVPDPADPSRSLLVDGQRAEGVELGLTGRLAENWSVAGGYAYQTGRILATQSASVVAGARLAQLPRHTGSLWQRYEFARAWGLGLGAVYRDAIFASTTNTVNLPGFVRFDAAVFWRISPRLRAQANLENIFDRGYHASAHSNTNLTPGSPRALRVSLIARF